MTVKELLELKEVKILSYKSILKHTERISTLFNFFVNEFKKKVSDSNCKTNLSSCFGSYKPKDNDSIFAYSNDWSFSKIKYSRVVNHVSFTDLTSARIGIVNDNFNFYDLGIIDVC